MNKTIVFVANGFTKDNVRLQPWRYVYEMAKHKSNNNTVYVITEGASDISSEEWDEGFIVVESILLSVKKQFLLIEYIKSLNPNELWWSSTPRTVAYYPSLLRIHCHKVAFITCPLYRWSELLRASMSGVPYEQSRALWSQRFVPRLLFRWILNNKLFNHVVVQSKNNQNILENNGVDKNKISLLPVGIDEEDANPLNENVLNAVSNTLQSKENEVTFLYLGALRPIRGFDSLIKAFPAVIKNNPNARLVVLARGATDEKCKTLLSELKIKGLDSNVSVFGGWLEKDEVRSYIELSDIVVLPFVLVPSDIPIAALEALARGKPIVVSPVDGLPELAVNRGIIVDPLNTQKFSDELLSLSEDVEKIDMYKDEARRFIETYPRWKDVGDLMDGICAKFN